MHIVYNNVANANSITDITLGRQIITTTVFHMIKGLSYHNMTPVTGGILSPLASKEHSSVLDILLLSNLERTTRKILPLRICRCNRLYSYTIIDHIAYIR